MRHFGERVEEEAVLGPEDGQDEEDAADGDEESELPDGHTGRGRKDFRERDREDRDGIARDVAEDEDGFERVRFEDPEGFGFVIVVSAFDGAFGEQGGDAEVGAHRGARVVAGVVNVVRVVWGAGFGFGVDTWADVVMDLDFETRGMMLVDVGDFGGGEWDADEEEFVCAAGDDGGVVEARVGAEDAGGDAICCGGFFAADGDDPVVEDGAVFVERFGEDGLDGEVVVGAAGIAFDEGRGGGHADDEAERCVGVIDDVEGFAVSGFGGGEGFFDGVADAVGLTLDLRGDAHADFADLGGGVVDEVGKDEAATDVKGGEEEQEKDGRHGRIARAD